MEEPSKNNYRSWEENTYWKHFHSVNFCQILPTDFQHELILPEKFAENMKGYLPAKVALKGPNEVTWKVNLSKGNERAVFQGDGWKRFVKAYSLKKADVLSFKYNRNECFEVLIFDGSNSCEKEASYFVRKFQKPRDNDEHVEKSMENPSEEVTERSKEQENDSENAPRNNYGKTMTRAGKSYFSDKPAQNRDALRENQQEEEPQTSDEEFSASEEQNSMEDTDGTPKNAVRARNGETPSNSSRKRNRSADKKTSGRKRWPEICYRSNRRPVTEAEKEKALQMAQVRASKYEDPFLVIMRPTSAYRRFFMSIPREWRPERYFKKSGEELILKVKDKTWVCKFCATCNNGGWQTGWKKFACDNILEEFDVCLFVPAEKKIDGLVVLDVSIFRVVPEVVPPSIITH